MRVCGTFCHILKITRAKERPQTHSVTREFIRSALFAVDNADGYTADETGFPDRLDRLKGGATGCHNVFDQTDQLSRFAYSFELVRGSVPLCLLSDN